MPEIILSGCMPEPLMSYLKALGVFRLVAEQADPAAKLSWADNICRLYSGLDRLGLTDFFLDRYCPTPILAPWNGGSGFYGGGAEPLNAIAGSCAQRLNAYRSAINAVRQFVPTKKPKDEEKDALLSRCRAELPDEVVPWLDTCFVLCAEGPRYFPLLGTGGNDGRLDFTNNFFQRLADVIPLDANAEASPESAGWLASALFGDDAHLTALKKAAVGQFNPGGIGGANGVQGDFEASSHVNPWEFILMIEGVLLFAGSVARRFGMNMAERAVFPFTVNSVAVGYGSATATEETSDGSRAELWLPLWDSPAGLSELQQLFAEGRAQIGRRQARNAVEFALAVCLLGVSRGIRAFVRYGFLKRNGLAFLAAPLGQVSVTPRPEARLLEDPPLADWIKRLRWACRDKEKTPARYQAALRNIDRAIFAFATGAQTDQTAERLGLLGVLRAVGRAERTLANGLIFCQDNRLPPLQELDRRWLEQANDDSAEFRLAAAIAGIRGDRESKVGPFRVHLEPLALNRRGRFEWDKGSTSAVWSKRPLDENLAAVFRRRLMEAFRARQAGLPLYSARPARLRDVLAFLDPDIDDEKLEKLHDLLWALCAVNWPAGRVDPEPANESSVPFEFGVPRLLVEPLPLAAERGRWLIMGENSTVPDPEVFHTLASGRKDAVIRCVDQAAQRLKSGGRLVVGYRNSQRAGKSLVITSRLPADRLLAACLIPLSQPDLETIANAVLYPPESAE
jgi:CRISPR-associated protein Csx17